MNYRRWFYGAKFWLMVALFAAYSAAAVGIVMIDTAENRYRDLAQVRLTKVDSDEQVRRGGAAQAAAVYRAQSGLPFSSLPTGSTFQIVWPDGSTETMTIIDPRSQNGIVPVAGSQQKPSTAR